MTPTLQEMADALTTQLEPKVPIPTFVITKPIPTLIPVVLPEKSKISSPFEDKDLSELASMISNPYRPPEVGSDDPHQGVDFSDVDKESRVAYPGREVKAIIDGEAIGIMQDRFPYGNAVLIKTNVVSLPKNWRVYLESLEIPGLWNKNTSLTCPEGWNDAPENQNSLSLYILYAHMRDPIDIELGQKLFSGDKLGVVGMSGNALAPHLHLEMRYGFDEESFGSMSHYDVTATQEEMSNYCRWRVSGWFKLIDPITILSID
ncbi:MAG: M23 family metallopeptidase [Anaerolineaceae bacterium]